MPFLDPDRPYTFSEIAKLKAPTDELLAEYGYSLERTVLDLSRYQGELDRLQERRSRIEEILPYLDLTNEQSRREMLIAPLMAVHGQDKLITQALTLYRVPTESGTLDQNFSHSPTESPCSPNPHVAPSV